MSDLQMGLILLGLALILLVVLLNWWQDWKVRTRMRQHFPVSTSDPLGTDMPATGRREPVLGNLPAVCAEDVEVDPHCEAVIDVRFAHPVAAETLMPALQALVVAAAKPVRLFAQGEDGGQRVRLAPGESCLNLQLAVLLANRAGPLSDIAWSSLWSATQALAEQFDGVVEGPELDAVVREATALDALCAELDATVNLQLKLSAPSPAGPVLRAAHEAGFAQHGALLVWSDASGSPRFTLHVAGTSWPDLPAEHLLTRLDLVLDIPNTTSDPAAFSQMTAVGRDLAARIHADLLDDQGLPLATHAEATIEEQLHGIAMRLEQAGFTPGSARCARVFA